MIMFGQGDEGVELVELLGEAEVGDLHFAAPCDHDVRGLDVAVHDAGASAHTPARGRSGGSSSRASCGVMPPVRMISARSVPSMYFHHEEQVVLGDAVEVVNGDDVRWVSCAMAMASRRKRSSKA